jgi:lycopene beta-cyclase
MNIHYDYIICGAGCAGLSLAYRLTSEEFADKKVLLIEKNDKNTNDRTWCFWEKEKGLFESIVYKSWESLNIYAGDFSKELNILPYRYKMIRGIDFYEFCLKKIRTCEHIKIIRASVHSVKSYDQGVSVVTNEGIYSSEYAFSSVLSGEENWQKSPYVLQHFRGWFLKSEKAIFNTAAANFMDFRIDQEKETRFFYVLPKNENEALVELAVFSKKPWESQFYDIKIDQYLKRYFSLENYEIVETENGIIPMTSYPFENHNTSRCIHIGTAGGLVKASTGFAFDRIQRHSKLIIKNLENGKTPVVPDSFFKNKYRWYDKVLLKVLTQNYAPADLVFQRLFQHNKIQDVLDFLNETSDWKQEFNILSAPPKWPFIRAAINL